MATSLCSNKRKYVSTAIEAKRNLAKRSRRRTCNLRIPFGHTTTIQSFFLLHVQRHFPSQSLPKGRFILLNKTVRYAIQKVKDENRFDFLESIALHARCPEFNPQQFHG